MPCRAVALVLFSWLGLGSVGLAIDEDDADFFAQKIGPLLESRCVRCHGPETQKGGLRLDSREALLKGGETGPAAVPGKPDESLMVEAVRYDGLMMPPKSKLPDGEIALLVAWIERGAPWGEGGPAAGAAASPADDMEERAGHWSFQPIGRPSPPEVSDPSWPLDPIDRFILAGLDERKLKPAAEADRRTWLRRVSFDLIGLPPTPEEVDAFLQDRSPEAFETVVDRLLASPRYGERWGRHWLDLVRYAETSGHEFDYDIPNAWRYRDYVIEALNEDLPYDRFVVEHVAGDLLPNPRRDGRDGSNRSILGTGFFLLGEGTHSPVDLPDERAAKVDNQIDVLGKTFLGLTLACARCHDHKFDPIRQSDYYALAGYLRSSRHQQAPIDGPEVFGEPLAELRSISRQLLEALPKPESMSAAPDHAGSVLFESFDSPEFGGWTSTGPAFGEGPTTGASLRVVDPSQPRLEIVPEGVAHSGMLSSRLEGVLRSPTFVIEHRYIWYLVQGAGARIHVVVDGFEKIRDPIYGPLTIGVDSPDAPRWVVQDVGMWLGHRAYIELADGGALDYRGALTAFVPGDGFLAVDEVRFSDQADPGPAPRRGPVAVAEATCDALPPALLDRYREVVEAIPSATRGLAMIDGTGEDCPLHIRGNTRTLGDAVPRHFPEVLGGQAPHDESGSGRMDLARRIVDPSNPLTARVIVNRLWHHHFGVGLVASPDDFGRMGQPPSHPELLDWLAGTFIDEGWSLKRMHRRIVLSRVYRQSSRGDADSDREDPTNRYLHRANLRRLEAEAIRDSILAVSGRLDDRMGGPGVAPHLTPFMDGRGRPSKTGPLNGDGRRTVYQAVRRNFLPPFLLAFDFPTPVTSMGRRNVSNVPSQALVLLNDPAVTEQARVWAGATCAKCPEFEARLDTLYRRAYGRSPTEAERAGAAGFVGRVGDSVDGWAELCHVLLNTKEFIYIP